MGSWAVGDGGTLGLEHGGDHRVAESMDWPSPSESFDSSYDSTTIGSDAGGDYKYGSDS